MSEELNKEEKSELELYRKYLQEASQPQTWDQKVAHYLGLFVAYSAIVFLLYLSWNFALVEIWPIVPNVTFLQMAGIWYLSSVLLKRGE